MFKNIIIAVCFLIISGCVNFGHNVLITSLVSPTYSGANSFVIIPKTETILETDLSFLEYKDQLTRALVQSGFTPSSDEKIAEMILLFDYGFGDSITRDTSVGDVKATRTDYEKYFDLTAIDGNEYNLRNEKLVIWSTHVKSKGRSDNLREIMPIMIAASIDYFGQKTDGQVTVNLDETDNNVALIRGDN